MKKKFIQFGGPPPSAYNNGIDFDIPCAPQPEPPFEQKLPTAAFDEEEPYLLVTINNLHRRFLTLAVH